METPAQYITIGYVAFMSTMATVRPIGDWLVTEFGVKRILQLSGVLIASGLLLAVGIPNLVTATLGFLLVGFDVFHL